MFFRCYQNTTIVTVDKSSSDSGSVNSKKATVKTLKKEVVEIYISRDENVEDPNPKPNGRNTIKVQHIPNSTNTIILKSPNNNQMMLTVRTERNTNDLSYVSSDNHPSSSSHISSKYSQKKYKTLKYQYSCVMCDAKFMNKCSLTIHQVQHIKSDRSSCSVFMAELTDRIQEKK